MALDEWAVLYSYGWPAQTRKVTSSATQIADDLDSIPGPGKRTSDSGNDLKMEIIPFADDSYNYIIKVK
jgi:hypothetical protein